MWMSRREKETADENMKTRLMRGTGVERPPALYEDLVFQRPLLVLILT